jgi:hypothetical protein
MPRYTFQDAAGLTLDVEADNEPTAADMEPLFAQVRQQQEVARGPSRGWGGDLLNATKRGFAGIPEMVGTAARGAYTAQSKLPTAVRAWLNPVGVLGEITGLDWQKHAADYLGEAGQFYTDLKEERLPLSRESKEEALRGAVTGGVESAIQSGVPMALTGGAGAGLALTAAAPAALFSGSQFDQSYREAKAKGLSDADATQYGTVMAISEGLPEYGGNLLQLASLGLGKALGRPVQGAAKQTLRQILQPGWKAVAKELVVQPGTEMLEEVATAGGQAAAGGAWNMLPEGQTATQQFLEQAKAAIGPAAVASLLQAGGVKAVQRAVGVPQRRAAIAEALGNANASPQARLTALAAVHAELQDSHPVEAEALRVAGTQAIAEKQAVPLDKRLREFVVALPEHKVNAQLAALRQRMQELTPEQQQYVRDVEQLWAERDAGATNPGDAERLKQELALTEAWSAPNETAAMPAAVAENYRQQLIGLARMAGEDSDRGRAALRQLLAEAGAKDVAELPDLLKSEMAKGPGPANTVEGQLTLLREQLAALNAQPAADVAEMGAVAAKKLEENKGEARRILHDQIARLEQMQGNRGQKTAPTLPVASRLETAPTTTTGILPEPNQTGIITGAETPTEPARGGAAPLGAVVTPPPGGASTTTTPPTILTAESGLKAPLTTAAEPAATGKAPWQMAQDEYSPPVSERQLNGRATTTETDRRVRQTTEHKTAVEGALVNGELSKKDYDALHGTAYGRYGSPTFKASFPKLATLGERVGGTRQYGIWKVGDGRLVLRMPQGADFTQPDTAKGRAALQERVDMLEAADRFDALIQHPELGFFNYDNVAASLGAMRSKTTGEKLPATAMLNERLVAGQESTEIKRARQAAARALGANQSDTQVVTLDSAAGQAVRAKLAAKLATYAGERGVADNVGSVRDLARALRNNGMVGPDGKPISERDAWLLAAVYGRLAQNLNIPLSQLVAQVQTRPAVTEKGQRVKGSLRGFDADLNGYILKLVYGRADASTVLHEGWHIVLKELAAQGSPLFDMVASEYEKTTKRKAVWVGDSGNQDQARFEEWAADRWEQWWKGGTRENGPLARVFAAVRDWLGAIYQAVKGGRLNGKLTPELVNVFETLLARQAGDSSGVVNSKKNRPAGDMVNSPWLAGVASFQDLPSSTETTSVGAPGPRPENTGTEVTTTALPGTAKEVAAESMPGSVAQSEEKATTETQSEALAAATTKLADAADRLSAAAEKISGTKTEAGIGGAPADVRPSGSLTEDIAQARADYNLIMSSNSDGKTIEAARDRLFALRDKHGLPATATVSYIPDMLARLPKENSGIANNAITPAAADGQIQDAGVKLGGARKDRVASVSKEISDANLSTMSFSEIWPKNEVDGIEGTDLAALATALRAVIPAKPRMSYKVARWVEKVKLVRSLMQYANENGFDSVMSKMAGGDYQRSLEGFREKVNLLRQLPRESWARVGKVANYPDAYRYDKDASGQPVRVSAAFATAEVDGRSVTAPNLEALREAVAQRLGGAAADTEMKFEIRMPRSGGSAFIVKTGDKLYRQLKEFTGDDAVKQARVYLKGNRADLVAAWEAVKATDNVKETDVRREANRPRTAKDYRQGKDVTSEMFRDTFGFRGVEFGNWVAQGTNQRDRQGMLNQAYDALMDLAGITGIPPKAISLNGELGLGFGSRGSGWAAAHYEPGKIVINLTKTRGAGTLAHEWFHALDHYFQRQRKGQASRVAHGGNMITYQPETYYENSQTGHRLSADRFKEVRLSNPADWKRIEGVRPEVEEAFTELVRALNESPMADRARLIDAGKSNGYWSRIIERAARGFENYVIHKMALAGYHNDYLANVASVNEFVRDKGRYPYLLENEVKPVAEAFDDLFATIKTRETDKGVELYQPDDAVRKATPQRTARTLDEARQAVKDEVIGRQLTNERTGLIANVSLNTLGKMTSQSAVAKSVDPVAHSMAVANVDHLFVNAEPLGTAPDKGGDINIKSIQRFGAALIVDGIPIGVKLTVKEIATGNRGNRIYSVEAVDVEKTKPTGNRVGDASLEAERATPQVGFDEKLRGIVDEVKKGQSQGHSASLSGQSEQSSKLANPRNEVKAGSDSEGELYQPDDAGDRYGVEERDGRLWVVDQRTGHAYKPTMTIYSGENTPAERDRLENNARVLNETEDPRSGNLRAVDAALEREPSAFSGNGGDRGRETAPTGGSEGAGGALPPVETHTPSPWLWILGNSGVDLLVKAGGPLKTLGEKVKAYYDRWADLKGQLGKPIRSILDPLSRAERRAVLDEFRQYMEARETGDRSQDKEALLAGMRPETRALAKAWDDLTEFTSAENQRLGVKVRDGDKWRAIGSFGRDYWPRMVREDITRILAQGKGAEFDRLIAEAAAHWNVTPERAQQKLAEAQGSLVASDDYFANLEAARTVELPSPWYEYRPEVVGARFIDSWAKRFAQIEAFGQVTTGAYAGEKSWSGQLFKDAFQQTRNDPHAGLVIRAVHDDVFGVRDKKFYDPVLNALRTYTALSKYVTNTWSALRNLTQPFVTTLPEFGPRAFARGMFDAVLHAKENFGLARDAGIVQDDLLAGFVEASDFSARQQKVIRNAAKWTGSEFAEQWNRVMTMATARAWARDVLPKLQSAPNSREALLAKAEFQRLEVDPVKLAAALERGDLHGVEWRQFDRAAVTGTQFGYDMRQAPVWSGTPLAKTLWQFARFGLQMHRRMWQEVVLPATKGETVDGVTVRNYGKALLTMGAMLGVGELMLTIVRAALFDKRRKDADWEEIAKTLDKDTWRGMQVALPHLVNNIWYSGALGSLADWGQNAYNSVTGFKGKNPLEPPSFSSIRNAVETGMRLFAEGINERSLKQNFTTWINNELPAINYGGAVVKRLTGESLLKAREDYREVKAAGGRFLAEIGEEQAKRGGEYTKTWKSPYYDDLFDALVTGDKARAQKVVDDLLATATGPDDKQKLWQGIKATTQSRRPLRAGGVDADTQRAFRMQFTAWLNDRRPDLAAKVQGLDAAYMGSASALGLAPSVAEAALRDKVAAAKERAGTGNVERMQAIRRAAALPGAAGLDAQTIGEVVDNLLTQRRMHGKELPDTVVEGVLSGRIRGAPGFEPSPALRKAMADVMRDTSLEASERRDVAQSLLRDALLDYLRRQRGGKPLTNQQLAEALVEMRGRKK